MADENKKVTEEIKEETAQQVETDTPVEEAKDEKATISVPKWLVKAARIGEAALAIFGGVVGFLLIKDSVSSRKRSLPAAQPQQIPTTQSILNESEPKVELTEF